MDHLIRALYVPAVPQGHQHGVITLGKSRGKPAELCGALEETLAEASKNPSERQFCSGSLTEGSAPWIVTLWNC